VVKFVFTKRSLQFSKITNKSSGNSLCLPPLALLYFCSAAAALPLFRLPPPAANKIHASSSTGNSSSRQPHPHLPYLFLSLSPHSIFFPSLPLCFLPHTADRRAVGGARAGARAAPGRGWRSGPAWAQARGLAVREPGRRRTDARERAAQARVVAAEPGRRACGSARGPGGAAQAGRLGAALEAGGSSARPGAGEAQGGERSIQAGRGWTARAARPAAGRVQRVTSSGSR
jgi:hypothetical protein